MAIAPKGWTLGPVPGSMNEPVLPKGWTLGPVEDQAVVARGLGIPEAAPAPTARPAAQTVSNLGLDLPAPSRSGSERRAQLEQELKDRLRAGLPKYQGFGAALLAGLNDLGMLTSAAFEATGEVTGIDSMARAGTRGREGFQETEQRRAADEGDRGKFSDIRSVGDALGWARQTTGNLIPVMIPGIAGGLATGGTSTVGAVAGAFLPSAALGVGEVQAAMKEKDPNAKADGWVFAGGTAIGALDSILPGQIGGKLIGAFGREAAEEIALRALLRPASQTALATVTREMGKNAMIEGVTESLQEAIGEVTASLSAEQKINWSAVPEAMLEAGAAGALMGGGTGAATGLAEARGARGEPQPSAIDTLDLRRPALTDDDRASPFPDDVIQQGKARIEEILGEGALDGTSKLAPLPEPTQAPATPRTPESPTPSSADATIDAFMRRARGAESGGNDAAQNPNSSASGRYQFTEATFKQVYQQEFGGSERQADAAWRESRNDPALQDRLMRRLTQDNAAGLESAGIERTEGNLYLAHFAGIGGAKKLHAADRDEPVESVLGQAVVNANPFLKGMTAGDVIAWAASKMGGAAPGIIPDSPATAPAATETGPSLAEQMISDMDRDREGPEDMLRRVLGEDVLEPRQGERVEVTRGDRTIPGTVEEVWERDGEQGVRIRQDDGSIFDETLADAREYGARITRPVTQIESEIEPTPANPAGVPDTQARNQDDSPYIVSPLEKDGESGASYRSYQSRDPETSQVVEHGRIYGDGLVTRFNGAGEALPVSREFAQERRSQVDRRETPRAGADRRTPANPAPPSTAGEPFDADKWQGERDDRIAASRAAGNKHLDDLNRSVEGMRGKQFYNAHDPKERGTVRTVANTGDVVVDWADDYSAKKNLTDTSQSWLMPSDLKDYVVGEPTPAESAPPANIAGEPIDKDYTRFSDDSGHIGIARADMPQIKAEHRGAMVNYLAGRGIKHEEVEVPAASLKPSQAEFSPEKVQQAREYEGGDRAILISSDGHVVDGHHQWLAAREDGKPVRAIKLDAPIREVLDAAAHFPSAGVAEGAPETTAAPQGGATIEDTASGKGIAVLGASAEQMAAITRALPENAKGAPRKDGALVFSKKHEAAIREALAPSESAKPTPGTAFSREDAVEAVNSGQLPSSGRVHLGRMSALTVRMPSGALEVIAETTHDLTDGQFHDLLNVADRIARVAGVSEDRAAELVKVARRNGTAPLAQDTSSTVDKPVETLLKDSGQAVEIGDLPSPWQMTETGEAPTPQQAQLNERVAANNRAKDGWPVEQDIRNLARDDGRFAVRGGARVTTQSGRQTSPAPKWNDSTPAMRTKSLKEQAKWLVQEAIAEAEQPGSSSANALPFLRRMVNDAERDNLSPSDHGTINDVLFGDYQGPQDAASWQTDRPPQKKPKPAPPPKPDIAVRERTEELRRDNAEGRLDDEEMGELLDRAAKGGTAIERARELAGVVKFAQPEAAITVDDEGTLRGVQGGVLLRNVRNVTEVGVAQAIAKEADRFRAAEREGGVTPSPNRLVTDERAAELRKKLREKLNQNRLNSGIDPELIALGTELAVYHIEKGARRFAAFAKALAEDLGMKMADLRPYLRGWYNGARDFMEDRGLDVNDMDGPDAVRAALAMIEDSEPAAKSGIVETEAPDAELPNRVPASDARPGAEAVSRTAEPAGRDGAAPRPEGRGSAGDVRAADRGREEAPERSAGGPERGAQRDRAGVRDADRVPEGREGSGRDGARVAPDAVAGTDWTIEPGSLAEDRSPAQKARDNVEAIELVKRLTAEGRPATREEQAKIARYVGWGGLKNIFPDLQGNYGKGFEELGPRLRKLLTDEEYETARRSIQWAHYTGETVVRAMWDMAERLGFRGGTVFEPGMGTGNFRGMMPGNVAAESQYSGIEYDHLTADIARLLYPQSGVRQADYTQIPRMLDVADLVIGNPPFAETAIKSDKDYGKFGFLIHDFFFAKAIDAVKPGGLLMFVTSAGTLNKVDARAREYIADRADLVAAVRLPGGAFEKNAGTSVTTDIVILRKRAPGEAATDRSWTGTVERELPARDGGTAKANVSAYFDAHPEMILGEQGMFDTLTAGLRYAVRAPAGFDLAKALREAMGRLPRDVSQTAAQPEGFRAADVDLDSGERKEGSFYIDGDGRLMQYTQGAGRPVKAPGKGVTGGISAGAQERIRALIPIKTALRQVYAADIRGDETAGAKARADLNTVYDKFVKQFGAINKSEITYRPATSIMAESARAEAREEARLAGRPWNEGSFNIEPLLERNASITEIARERKIARENAITFGQTWDEGSFDPDDVPEQVIEKRPNLDPFMADEEGYRLAAIEHFNKETGEAAKGRVFFENALKLDSKPKINSAQDALLYSLNQRGHPDIDLIAQMAGLSRGEALEELASQLFAVPGIEGKYETAEIYLSGNVREKLALAEREAARDPSLQRNVEALRAVQPRPLTPSEIAANLGMPWLPPEVVKQFATERLGLSGAAVTYQPRLARWAARGNKNDAAATQTWGTQRDGADGFSLLEAALNRQTVKIYDKIRTAEGETRVLNTVDTQAAQDKQAEIQQAFRDWVWTDETRSAELVDLYNHEYNSLVAPKFDGSYLTTPGISSGWSWRPHQRSVVSRIIQSGNTYMAHEVGAGKTSAMIGAGMEMKRLGLVNKPMYVVPNHMLGQFTKEFYEQYPLARIKVADEQRFHTMRRKSFVAQLAAEDLDAIIITHSAFGFIGMSDEFQARMMRDELADLVALLSEIDKSDRVTRRTVEQQKQQLSERLAGLTNRRRDQVFTFEETGIDFLFVDEAHLFRKLSFATKMGQVKGVDPSGSQASFDLYSKVRYLESQRPGRSVVLASGTPITNTMAELFSVSRYLQQRELEKRGLGHFDAWAGAFGETVTALEQNPAGGYDSQTRFAKFVNVPELSVMVRQVMDVVGAQELRQYVSLPNLKGGQRNMIVADQTDEQADYQETLKTRIEAIKKRTGPPKKGDDILLSVIGDGRKNAIDYRLVEPDAPKRGGSKLELLIERTFQNWEATKRQPFHQPLPDGKGYSEKPTDFGPATQMIFADLGINGGFPIHKYIKQQLIARGIPEKQVAIISDYKSHVAKQRLFNDMNEGKVRVLIGSVPKMGTGVNAQRRLYAIHNLDPQWYPANDTQRNGRGIRQGNMNPEIEINDYSTHGTYDSQMWALMAKKARFIEGFMRGDPDLRDMEDLGEASQYEQAQAITTADARIMDLTEWKQELEKVERRAAAHERAQQDVRLRIHSAESHAAELRKIVPLIEQDIAAREPVPEAVEYEGATYEDKAEFGERLLAQMEEALETLEKGGQKRIGKYRGFTLKAERGRSFGGEAVANLIVARAGGRESVVKVGDSARGLVTRLDNALGRFEEELAEALDGIARNEKAIADFTPKLGQKFDDGGQAAELREKIGTLERTLAQETRDAEAGKPRQSRVMGAGRAASIEALAQRERELQLELGLQLQRFGISDRILLEAARGLNVGPGAQGESWNGVIRIALDKTNNPGHVLSHEAVHAMRDLGLFTPAEWRSLLKDAWANDRIREITRKAYGDRGLGLEDLKEEAAAELFAEYWSAMKTPNATLWARASRRIFQFIVALAAAANKLLGRPNSTALEALLIQNKIISGEIGARETGSGDYVRYTPDAPAHVFGKKRQSLAAPGQFTEPETEKRWDEARKGVGDGPGTIAKAGEWWSDLKAGFTRHWRDLPNEPRFADVQQQFRKLEAAPDAAMDHSVRYLRGLVGKMDKAEYDLFSRKVVLDDLAWETGEEHQLPFGFTPETLQLDLARIDAEVAKSPKLIEAVRARKAHNKRIADDMVRAGVLTREQIKNPAYYRHMVLDYARHEGRMARGANKVKSPYWAKRMGSTLDINANLLEAELDWLQKAQIDIATADTIKWLRESEHNIRDKLREQARESNRLRMNKAIDGDPELAEIDKDFRQQTAIGFKFVTEAIESGHVDPIPSHLEGAASSLGSAAGDPPFALLSWMLDNDKPGAGGAAMVLKAAGLRKAWMRQVLGEAYIDPDDIAGLVRKFKPEGFTDWQPREGRHFFTAKTISEAALDMFVGKLSESSYPGVSRDELHKALTTIRPTLVVGGDRYTMVIPDEIALTLDEFGDRRGEGMVASVFSGAQAAWKRWVLINPRRFLKYNINNLSGDLDAIIAGNPGALSKLGAAWRDLRAAANGKPSDRYIEAQERGVFTSGLSVQEIPDINRLSELRHLTEDRSLASKVTFGAVGTVWRALQDSTQFRENLFRHAAYLDYVEKIEAGKPMREVGYGASIPRMVDAVADPKDRAALLARDLVGDYGAISVAGSWLRKYLIPFWSWTEINTRRYWRLTSNVYSTSKARGLAVGGLLGATAAARVAATLAIRMGMLYGLLWLWNNLLFGDEEDDLGDLQKRQMHLILGRNDDGEVITLRTQGALSDVLSTFGFPDAVKGLKDYMNGQGTIGQAATDTLKAPANRVATGITPLFGVPIEQMLNAELWPDAFDPRPIKDRWRHLFSTFSLEHEYDQIADKPTRGYARSWEESLIYRRDPGEMAYDEAKGIAYDWLQDVKGQDGVGGTSPRSAALRDYRLSMRYGDQESADEALIRYAELGGTDGDLETSIKRQHPLGPIAKKDRAEFLDSLTEDQLGTFYEAEEWYNRIYLGIEPAEQQDTD